MSKRSSDDSPSPVDRRQRAMSPPHRPPSRMSDCWHGHSCRKPGCSFTHPQDLKKDSRTRTHHDHIMDNDSHHSPRSDGDSKTRNAVINCDSGQRATHSPILPPKDRTVGTRHDEERNQKDDTPTVPTQPRSSRDPRLRARFEDKALTQVTGSLLVDKAISVTKTDKMNMDGLVPKVKATQTNHLQNARGNHTALQSNNVTVEALQTPGVGKQPAVKKQEDFTNPPRSSSPLSTPHTSQIAAIQNILNPNSTSRSRTGAETMFITKTLTIAIDLRIRISGLENEKRSTQANLQKYKDADKQETSRLKQHYDSEKAKLDFLNDELARLSKRSEKSLADLARYISVAPHLSDIVANYRNDNAALRKENELLRECINSNAKVMQQIQRQQFGPFPFPSFTLRTTEDGKAWKDIISRIFKLESVLSNIVGSKTTTRGGSDVRSINQLDVKLQRLDQLLQEQRTGMPQDLATIEQVMTLDNYHTESVTIAIETMARFNDFDTKIIHELGHITSNIKDVRSRHTGPAGESDELRYQMTRRTDHLCKVHEEFVSIVQLRLDGLARIYRKQANANSTNEHLQRQSSFPEVQARLESFQKQVQDLVTKFKSRATSLEQLIGVNSSSVPITATNLPTTTGHNAEDTDVVSFAQQVATMELQLQGLTECFDEFTTDQHARAIANAMRHLWPQPLATTRRLVAVEQQILNHEQRALGLAERINSAMATETGLGFLNQIRGAYNVTLDVISDCKTLFDKLSEAVKEGRSNLELEELYTYFHTPEQDLHTALKKQVEKVEAISEALNMRIESVGLLTHNLEDVVQKIDAMPSGEIFLATDNDAEVSPLPTRVAPTSGLGSSMLQTRKPPMKRRKLNEDEDGEGPASAE